MFDRIPDAVAVMDPFHVVRLAGDALDLCRRPVHQASHGHRGRKDDPLYKSRRTLHTGAGLLTDRQRQRLTALFADGRHVEVEATWGIYQRMIAAYREPNRTRSRELMSTMIDSVRTFRHEDLDLFPVAPRRRGMPLPFPPQRYPRLPEALPNPGAVSELPQMPFRGLAGAVGQPSTHLRCTALEAHRALGRPGGRAVEGDPVHLVPGGALAQLGDHDLHLVRLVALGEDRPEDLRVPVGQPPGGDIGAVVLVSPRVRVADPGDPQVLVLVVA